MLKHVSHPLPRALVLGLALVALAAAPALAGGFSIDRIDGAPFSLAGDAPSFADAAPVLRLDADGAAGFTNRSWNLRLDSDGAAGFAARSWNLQP